MAHTTAQLPLSLGSLQKGHAQGPVCGRPSPAPPQVPESTRPSQSCQCHPWGHEDTGLSCTGFGEAVDSLGPDTALLLQELASEGVVILF